jgi:HSP20 family protein
MTGGEGRSWAPRVDVVREKDRVVVQAELPGIKPEEVEISVEGDVLTISGHHEQSKEEKDKHLVRRERRYGSFSRSMPLPSGVDSDQIEADYADGVLEVSIPVPPEKEAKRVEIKPRVRE